MIHIFIRKLGHLWFRWWLIAYLPPSHYLNQCWFVVSWWRHQMETFSALLAICAGNSLVPVNSPHKGQWRRALMFTLICARINGWVNNRETGDLRRYCAHYDVIVMYWTLGNKVHWQQYSYKKIRFKMSSAKWQPFCLSLTVLTKTPSSIYSLHGKAFPGNYINYSNPMLHAEKAFGSSLLRNKWSWYISYIEF